MVVSVHHKSLGGERSGKMIVSADMFAHAVDQHNGARAGLAVLSGPAIAGELPAVGRT